MVDETDESEWGTAVDNGLASSDDDDLPQRMTEDEAMAVGNRGDVESVTLHRPDDSEEWTAMFDGIEVSRPSRVGALEAVVSELRGREE